MVTLDDGTVIRARAVVLTAGIETPVPRPLDAGAEWACRGRRTVIDPATHAGQDVVIVGGGDSALDWADALNPIARSVRLVHRRAVFRGHAAALARVREGGTVVHTDTEVAALTGDHAAGRLEKVTLRARNGDEQVVAADHVIAALGFISDLGPMRDWGLKLSGRSVAVDGTGRTSLPRVYAAGDLTDYEGKVKLMSVGFGEVATAMTTSPSNSIPTWPCSPATPPTTPDVPTIRKELTNELRHRSRLHRYPRPLVRRGMPRGLHLRG